MTKIERKPSWSLYSEPEMPFHLRREPQKMITKETRTQIKRMNQYDYHLSLDFLEGYNLGEIECSLEKDYDDDDCPIAIFDHVIREEMENDQYENQIRQFRKEMKAHKEDVEQWKLWKQHVENNQIESQLQAARELLKKHGELK